MSSPATGDASDESNRYDPFSHRANDRRAEERTAQSEREMPDAVPSLIFQAADQDNPCS